MITTSDRAVTDSEAVGLRTRFGSGATVEWTDRDGSVRSTSTETPTRTVAELAARFDGEVPDLRITRPTLEDVYLRLTGRLDRNTTPQEESR